MADLVRVDDLARYLATIRRRRFAFGDLDCCTLMADWLIAIGLPDPMADRRGTYGTARQYRTAMRQEGGIVRSCMTRFARIGLTAVQQPSAGDVALVMAPTGLRRDGRVVEVPTGAICVDHVMRAVVTPDAGIVGRKMKTLMAWTIPHG